MSQQSGSNDFHKASKKMMDILISKHGREKAMQIITQEQDRWKRKSILNVTPIASSVAQAVQDPNSVFYNTEMLEVYQDCPLYNLADFVPQAEPEFAQLG